MNSRLTVGLYRDCILCKQFIFTRPHCIVLCHSHFGSSFARVHVSHFVKVKGMRWNEKGSTNSLSFLTHMSEEQAR